MEEQLPKDEARQGEARRTNKVALLGLPLAFIVLAILYFMWA